MRDLWDRIERLLQTHNPRLLAKLAPGADEASLDALEAKVGVTLPDDFRASYRIHNGSGEWPIEPYGELLSLAGIAEKWDFWRAMSEGDGFEGMEAFPEGPIRTDAWFNARWLPLTDNQSNCHRCLDLNPAPGGSVGQVITFLRDDGAAHIVAPSFRAYLEAFADTLAAGHLEFEENRFANYIGPDGAARIDRPQSG